ncbi:MAG: hypothetical protein QM528_00045 [Phycisphaerales bacterium]|nr:hypothetical protein [Phycisphaerales bacterium]
MKNKSMSLSSILTRIESKKIQEHHLQELVVTVKNQWCHGGRLTHGN